MFNFHFLSECLIYCIEKGPSHGLIIVSEQKYDIIAMSGLIAESRRKF